MSAIPEQRVVIFGREGLAREQLVAALSDFGVEPIWVGKPVQSNPEKLSEMNPSQIIISLEPLIESELMPYSDFLNQSEISVLYDDAESTRHLSGWDLNRWARHMAAKLLNQDYMPAAKHMESKARDEIHEFESQDFSTDLIDSEDVAVSELSVEQRTKANEIEVDDSEDSITDWQSTENYDALDINPAELSAALEQLNQNLASNSDQAAIREMDYEQLIPLTDSELHEFESQPATQQNGSEIGYDFSLEDDQQSDSINFDLTLEVEVAEEDQLVYMDEAALLRAEKNLEAQLANSDAQSLMDSKLTLQTSDSEDVAVVSASESKPKAREFDLSKFSLVDDNENIDTHSLVDIKQPLTDEVTLTELNPVSEKSLFLVISGLGGPGIVRSIVGKLKSNFSGIMVLAQTIEPVQLPKFLIQLQKVVSIPVIIPSADEYLKNGNVYLLPEKHSIQPTALGYQCVANGNMSDFITQVDQHVEIVVLSGSDATLAQSLIQVSAIMTNIYVQSPDDCFDATLPQLLVNMGVPVLRQDILDAWFN
jgi:chemotaxis response regulator CheB